MFFSMKSSCKTDVADQVPRRKSATVWQCQRQRCGAALVSLVGRYMVKLKTSETGSIKTAVDRNTAQLGVFVPHIPVRVEFVDALRHRWRSAPTNSVRKDVGNLWSLTEPYCGQRPHHFRAAGTDFWRVPWFLINCRYRHSAPTPM